MSPLLWNLPSFLQPEAITLSSEWLWLYHLNCWKYTPHNFLVSYFPLFSFLDCVMWQYSVYLMVCLFSCQTQDGNDLMSPALGTELGSEHSGGENRWRNAFRKQSRRTLLGPDRGFLTLIFFPSDVLTAVFTLMDKALMCPDWADGSIHWQAPNYPLWMVSIRALT